MPSEDRIGDSVGGGLEGGKVGGVETSQEAILADQMKGNEGVTATESRGVDSGVIVSEKDQAKFQILEYISFISIKVKNDEWGLQRGDSLSFRDVSLSFKEMLILKATPKSILVS